MLSVNPFFCTKRYTRQSLQYRQCCKNNYHEREVQSLVHRAQITVIKCTILCTQFTLLKSNVHRTMYTFQSIRSSVHRTMCTFQSTVCTVHITMHTVLQALKTEDSGQTIADSINWACFTCLPFYKSCHTQSHLLFQPRPYQVREATR